MKHIKLSLAAGLLLVGSASAQVGKKSSGTSPVGQLECSTVLSLDGEGWLLATDPENVGQSEQWWQAPRPEANRTKVPWIIQDAFPGYHGLAWYWRDFGVPANPHPQGRCLLRFWAVDYKADVWVNGAHVGGHENGETPFILDVTDVVRPGQANRLAIRVLNPTHQPIDGIVLRTCIEIGSGTARAVR